MIGSILFNRTLKQFLDCQDLDSEKGVKLTQKVRDASGDWLDKLIELIPTIEDPHSAVLKSICIEHANTPTQEIFLDKLENEVTNIRTAAADILSQSSRLSPSKLFKKLHESDVSKTEIIDILSFRKSTLKPEQLVTNALKMDKTYAEKLFALATETDQALDIDGLIIVPDAISSPTLKIMLVRYLSTVPQAKVAEIITKFVADPNKTVVIESLKSLAKIPVPFDATSLLPFIETLSEHEQPMAIDIVKAQANTALVPHLAAWTTGKSDLIRDTFIKLVVAHADATALEKFLKQLDRQEWWGKEQASKALHKEATPALCKVAAEIADNEDEYVRGIAQQLAAQGGDPEDLTALQTSAMHENWQVREKAIAGLGSTHNRESLECLKKVLKEWPESAQAVLKAVRNLGFSKGLESAFLCLKMPEALVQREALETIGALATKGHAEKIRENIMIQVPKLQATVRDTAGEVVYRLTEEYGLQALNVDAEKYFETRLIKIGESSGDLSGSFSTTENSNASETKSDASMEKTEVVRFQNIEELKEGDIWMDRFRINKEIGRGAMGRVMLTEDEMVGEELILKFMHPELTADGASRERFLREVKYSRKISHPNVIRIHDMLFKDNLCAISMEYFLSRGIDEILLEKGSFETREGLEILLQVSKGMAAAHDQEVIHRDLKPSNILMNDKGLVKVVDFGIASASSNSDATLTKTGLIIGTPAYLSPERARGYEAHYRCDIYALGVIAYCMFAGKLPYRGEPMSLLFQHLEGKAKPVHEIKPEINPRIGRFVKKLMAVDAEKRVQTMDEASEAIEKELKKV